MAFVSLKRYLRGGEGEGAYKRIIALLLNGITESAVHREDEEYGRFRADMLRIGAGAREAGTEEDLFVAAGSALQALDSYNQRTARVIRQQEAEMNNIASMLAQTVLVITERSDRSGDVLSGIKRDLENAAAIEDIQNVRVRLEACLQKVREEALQQKREAEATVNALREQTAKTEVSRKETGVDPTTGLRGRAAAERFLQEMLDKPGRKYVLTMVMERFELITSRFGATVAEAAVRSLSQHVDRQLPGCVGLFRWTGPALVAVLNRPESIDMVRNQVKRALETRLEKSFSIGARSALVPIAAAWSVAVLMAPVSGISKSVDAFVATQTPHEYA